MGNKAYDVLYARRFVSNGEERIVWHQVGRAWENPKGGFDIKLYLLPGFDPTEQAIRLTAREAQPRPQRGGGGYQRDGGQGQGQPQRPPYTEPGDDVPF